MICNVRASYGLSVREFWNYCLNFHKPAGFKAQVLVGVSPILLRVLRGYGVLCYSERIIFSMG